ncbi:MAG: VaFE repeat-containing surface-anchored protein [Lachnospiraceae bacterium]|nr:VaFE repeat-containing surface-anchored protein [Lachnospiraceae bacterium]
MRRKHERLRTGLSAAAAVFLSAALALTPASAAMAETGSGETSGSEFTAEAVNPEMIQEGSESDTPGTIPVGKDAAGSAPEAEAVDREASDREAVREDSPENGTRENDGENPCYSVTLLTAGSGTLSFLETETSEAEYQAGEAVTVIAEPESEWYLSSLTAQGESITETGAGDFFTEEENQYSFTMPAGDLSVRAVFSREEALETEGELTEEEHLTAEAQDMAESQLRLRYLSPADEAAVEPEDAYIRDYMNDYENNAFIGLFLEEGNTEKVLGQGGNYSYNAKTQKPVYCLDLYRDGAEGLDMPYAGQLGGEAGSAYNYILANGVSQLGGRCNREAYQSRADAYMDYAITQAAIWAVGHAYGLTDAKGEDCGFDVNTIRVILRENEAPPSDGSWYLHYPEKWTGEAAADAVGKVQALTQDALSFAEAHPNGYAYSLTLTPTEAVLTFDSEEGAYVSEPIKLASDGVTEEITVTASGMDASVIWENEAHTVFRVQVPTDSLENGSVTVTAQAQYAVFDNAYYQVSDREIQRFAAMLEPDTVTAVTHLKVTGRKPALSTSASDRTTGTGVSPASATMEIRDLVSYENLEIGKTYQVIGKLYDAETGQPALDDQGNEITADTEFSPETTEGSTEVVFSFSGTHLAGTSLVVFEELYAGEKMLASHADLTDSSQTVAVPKMGTKAEIVSDSPEDFGVADTISYENLPAGHLYLFRGTLTDRESGEAIRIDGKNVTAEEELDLREGSGTVSGSLKVVFPGFDTSSYAGKDVVVFERCSMYLPDQSEVTVMTHEDPDSETQLVSIPEKPEEPESEEPESEKPESDEPKPEESEPEKPESDEPKPEEPAQESKSSDASEKASAESVSSRPETGDSAEIQVILLVMLLALSSAGVVFAKKLRDETEKRK